MSKRLKLLPKSSPGLSSAAHSAEDKKVRIDGNFSSFAEQRKQKPSVARQENDCKYQMLMEEASDGIHTYDFQGNIIETNSKLCEMLGYSSEELLQLNVKDLVPAEDLAVNPIRFEELRAGKTLLRERLLRRKDGSLFPAEISGKMIQDGILLSIIRDITERKNTEKRLGESEELLRTIFDASQDGILIEDEEKIKYVNKSYIRLFEYNTAEELIGQHISTVISDNDKERVMDFGKSRLRGEQTPSKYEFQGKRKDKSSINVEATVSVSNVADHTYITTMIRDISERKRMEAIIEAQKQSLEMIVVGKSLDEVLTYLTVVVEQQAEWQAVASVLLLDRQGHLYNGASPSLPLDYIQAINGIKADPNLGTCCAAAALGEPVVTPDIAADKKWQSIKHLPLELGFQSAWSMPIKAARDGRILGTFGTYFREKRKPSDFERQMVEILARTAALAIERRESEEALEESQSRLRIAVEAAELGTWDWNLITNETKWNERHFLLFGIKPSNFAVKTEDFFKHIHPEDRDSLREQLNRTIEDNVDLKGEFRIVSNGGIVRWLNVYGRVVERSSGRSTRMSGVIFDITENKQAEEILRRSNEELEFRVQERTRELERTNKALRAESLERRQAEQSRIEVLHQLVTVQEDERQRFARDLHDQLGQQLTALRLKLEVIKNKSSRNEELYEEVDATQQVARQLDSDVDFLAWQMRPTALDDLGIAAALAHYVHQWSKYFNIPAEFNASRFGRIRLTTEAETNFYRITQEALNNTAKHAQASIVNVLLESRDGFAVLIIEDNGIGFEPDKKNAARSGGNEMGLIGMQERSVLIGGTIEIESGRGSGTTIFVSVPIRGELK